jgi:undecaprenyl-diphosphatase
VTLVHAILLGLIQGLSEFLPISSTAHLTLAARGLGLIDPAHPERWTAFVAVIQLGTLIAVLAYFRRDLVAITRAFITENIARRRFAEQSVESRTGLYIIIGTIPIVVIGLLFRHQIEGVFTKNLIVIGSSLIVLGLVLEIAERVARFARSLGDVTTRDAILIGLAQAVALIPGSSRSGTTITAALFQGFNREAAARFSFLLSIPAVAASGLLELVKSLHDLNRADAVAMAVATIVSGISGYMAIAFLLRYLRTRTTRIFVVYRVLLGAAILLGVYLKYLSPDIPQ